MAKKSAKSRKPAAKRKATPKAKAKSRPKAGAKAGRSKKRVSVKAKARRKVTAKAKSTRKAAPKAKAKSSRKAAPKVKSTHKAAPKAKAKSSRKAAPKAKAKRRTSPRAKSVRKVTPKVQTKKRTSPKAKSVQKVTPKVQTKKRTSPKPRPTVTARKKTTTAKTTRVVHRQSPATPTEQFDFNAWMLPTLDLEKYEPNIQEEAGVEDKIKGSTRFAWIGAGQCGGRLVKSFYDLGYKKVLAVNTTHHDLDMLQIPESQKFPMEIGEKGAGKDMQRGKLAVENYNQEILHLTRQIFGTQVDHIMVCFGAGGGTGSGSASGLIEVAKRYARYMGFHNPEKSVGVIMTLPTVGEASSPLVAENAYKIASELSEMAAEGQISPFIIIDNEKISKLYPGMTVKSFWPSINRTVAGLFDIFNRLSSLSSPYTAFDPVDYHSIMEVGGCAIMGLTKVDKFNDRFAISEAVKKNLEKTLLASGFDLSSAKLAGCIVVGSRNLMARAKGLQDNINYAFDVLSEITGKATIHRGIYEDNRDSLRVYTIIGGLSAPTQRLEELTSCTMVQAR